LPLQQVSRRVPIVFTASTDPVGAGVVESLSRPGSNATGFISAEFGMSAKWLELLKEVAPGVTRAAVLLEPSNIVSLPQFAAVQTVAPSFRVELSRISLSDAEQIERSVAIFAGTPNGGLIVSRTSEAIAHRALIIALAARHRLPAVYPLRLFVNDGGLVCYGPDIVDQYRLAAGYVDRILKGEKPADLPVQAPTKYELVINLKTARALGLDVPPSLLARADELRTGLWRPTLEDENGKPLANLGLLAKPTRLAIVPWLLVFFIGASSSRCSAARRHHLRGRSRRARSNRQCRSLASLIH